MQRHTQVYYSLYLFIFTLSHAQAPDTQWTNTYGGHGYETAYSIQQTYDGGYIVAGYTKPFGVGGSDMYLIKTDPTGKVIWAKTYGGTDNETACAVEQTSDGGYIVAGTTSSFGAGNTDMYIVKTDAFGDTVFTKTYGDTLFEICVSILQNTNDGYIITGNRRKASHKHIDILLIKTNSDGDISWTSTYDGSVQSIKPTLDNGYILTGQDTSKSHLQLLKIDENGAVEWKKGKGNFGGLYYSHGEDVELALDGGYIIVGSIWNWEKKQTTQHDLYIVKTDANGDSIWSKTYGGYKKDIGYAIQSTDDCGYVITGITGVGGHGMWLVKIDINGDTLWTKTYGGIITDCGYSVQQTSDGGYIIVGQTTSFGPYDIYIVKTKPEFESR